MAKTPVVFDHQYAFGDTLLFQGAVRDFARKYGDRYEIHVVTHYRNLWEHNPFVAGVYKRRPPKIKAKPIEMRWISSRSSHGRIYGRPAHILGWYHHNISRALQLPLSPLEPKGAFYFSETERRKTVEGRAVFIVAGGKIDASVKIWSMAYWQKLVDLLRGAGIHVIQGGGIHRDHIQFPLKGTISTLGYQDDGRDFMRLIRDCEMTICGVSAPMHAAAIVDRPCVVIAGGREDPCFEAYDPIYQAFGDECSPIKVPHRFLHTIGQLDCCKEYGCWKHSVRALKGVDRTKKDRMCRQIEQEAGQTIAACQRLISPEEVFDAAMSYYRDGTLPPPDDKPPRMSWKPPERPLQRMIESSMRLFPGGLVLDAPPPRKPEPVPPPKPIEAAPGRRYTMFVLCSGDYPQLVEKCVSSVLASVPRERLDLRIGLNECSPGVVARAKAFEPDALYEESRNLRKYPLMRKMFRDPAHPVTTDYLLWFDEDAYVVDPTWLGQLDRSIDAKHPYGYRMFGAKLFHDLRRYRKNGHDPLDWFRAAPWWQNRPLRVARTAKYSEAGTCIDFAVGWFWAAHYESLVEADVPDGRLANNFGDITIGEQMHQAGFQLSLFNPGKSLVACPIKEQGGRRGFFESKPPWSVG